MMEKTSYVQKKYIKKDTVEMRDYQKHLAMYAKDKNTMVVLPTGLGKTVVALHIIADHLENKQTPVLFLAPTRVLVGQHQNFLLANTTIADIIMITGESTIEKRRKQNSIVCAKITRNDLTRVETSTLYSPSRNFSCFNPAPESIPADFRFSRIMSITIA